MSTLRSAAGVCVVAGAIAVIAGGVQAVSVSNNWATGAALDSVAVVFNEHVTVFYGASLGDTENVPLAGVNAGAIYDNAANLLVANSATSGLTTVNQVAVLGEQAPHGVQQTLLNGSTPASLALAGDGTLYIASPGGSIRRYSKTRDSYTDFTVKVETTSCIGIDLSGNTLYIVSGGRNVFMLPGADVASGDQTANTVTFTPKALNGQGAACAVRLVAPERGSTEKRHGGMFVADRRDIKRLNRLGAEIAAYRSPVSPSSQNWVDVAVDPRIVYDANNPATGVDPNEYIFWGIDASQRLLARFQTDQSQYPVQSVSTGLETPKGIAINSEHRVAQIVRPMPLSANTEGSVTFLEGTPYKHTLSAQSSDALDLAVMTFEVVSDGVSPVLPGSAGRCDPSLDVDCRFVSYLSPGPPAPVSTPTAIAYSRGRAVGYRLIRFAPLSDPGGPPLVKLSLTYADGAATSGGAACPAATSAVSILRDPYIGTSGGANGHDQFESDNTMLFFDGDDEVTTTDPLGGTDYIAVRRSDVKYSIEMVKPNPAIVSTPQLGSSQPITLNIQDPANGCQPVGGLENVLVLTVTEYSGDPSTTKGVVLGDSLTPGSLGVNGLSPWSFTQGQWRTNLALDPPQFKADYFYSICVIGRAVNNARLIGDACAVIKPVEGSGR